MPDPSPTPLHDARRRWMAVLARAPAPEIEARLSACGELPEYRRLRGPETGLVMVRGRMGGGGSAFNLGEMSVTRCTVRTTCGRVGHAYVAGRDARQAELAALVDAVMQDPARQAALRVAVVEPLAAAQERVRAGTAGKAAATRVEFFTMTNMRA
jgi:alpha-D-ribose 1-methylphosphonate 5-triphosphate synthase subunit PhnG